MFTNTEVDALARDILTHILKDFGTHMPSSLFQVFQAENGEQVAIYTDTSLDKSDCFGGTNLCEARGVLTLGAAF